MTPSSSTYTYSFGFHSTCPNCNEIFRSPFLLLHFYSALSLTLKYLYLYSFSSLESRTYPYTIIPASFLSSAIAAKLSPSNAQFVDAPHQQLIPFLLVMFVILPSLVHYHPSLLPLQFSVEFFFLPKRPKRLATYL